MYFPDFSIVFPLVFLLATTCMSLSVQTKLLTRQIQSQPSNITHALHVISQIDVTDDDAPFIEALRVCGKSQRPDLVLDLYQQHPSEACRTMAISVLGACQRLENALALLSYGNNASCASYNAAIAACGKAKDWKRAISVYEEVMPSKLISTLTCNVMLSTLAKCRQGVEASRILSNIPSHTAPDRRSYQYLVSAMVRSDMLDDATKLLEKMQRDNEIGESSLAIQPTEAMYDMVIAAYSKISNWEGIKRVEQIRNPNSAVEGDVRDLYSFQRWEGLTKVGKGKEAYWEVATHLPLNITIGVQPNRNPMKNGIRLLFYENYNGDGDWKRRKLAFLLMKNSENQSSLLGMFLQDRRRGQGLSKICLGVWLWFCCQASIEPVTGIINKPLLSLLLQHRFMFVPERGGVEVEVTQDPDNPKTMLLYSPCKKSLEGAFSPWDVQNQNIRLLEQTPEPRGRRIHVRTAFNAPDSNELQALVQDILGKKALECHLSSEEIRHLYFGKKAEKIISVA